MECMTLGDLEERVMSERRLTIKDIFKVQLQHIPGIDKQVAEALVGAYPTPMALCTQAVCRKEEEGGGEKGLDEMAAEIKQVPLCAQGRLNKRTVGETKAKKILKFLGF